MNFDLSGFITMLLQSTNSSFAQGKLLRTLKKLRKLIDKYYFCLSAIELWAQNHFIQKLQTVKTVEEIKVFFAPIYEAINGRELPGNMSFSKAFKLDAISYQSNSGKLELELMSEAELSNLQKLTDKYYNCCAEIDFWSETNLYPQLEAANTVQEVIEIFVPIQVAGRGIDERGERVVMRSLPINLEVKKIIKVDAIQRGFD